MDEKTPRKASTEDIATKPLKPARVALNVLALCFALSVLGRGLGESFTVFLKPISESFGWDRAQVVSVYSLICARGRIGVAADWPAVRLFRPAQRLFARAIAARRRVPVRRACAAALAVPVKPRPLRRRRHRLYRQRAELHPARTLVRPAIADRDGGRLFRDRRRRADPAAGLAGPDRASRLAWRLSGFRRRRAVSAVAAIDIAVAAVLQRLPSSRQARRR